MDIVLSGLTTVGNVADTIESKEAKSAPVKESAPIQDVVVPKEDDTMSYFEKLANS